MKTGNEPEKVETDSLMISLVHETDEKIQSLDFNEKITSLHLWYNRSSKIKQRFIPLSIYVEW